MVIPSGVEEKYASLKEVLTELGSVAVAFSGGVDSTFLLKAAHDALGDRAVAVTARTCFFPARESREAEEFCRREGIRQIFLDYNELEIEGIRENPPDRCYFCKKTLFGILRQLAQESGYAHVAEGSNADDVGDYRPGLRAIAELGIRSPLREVGLNKEEIRLLSRRLGLAVWDKPAAACLASRFAYGERISKERLSMVETAEDVLMELGFLQMRVRIHGSLARIEVPPEELPRLMAEPNRRKITDRLKHLGFSYVTVDLTGYRTGSMNEVLPAVSANPSL